MARRNLAALFVSLGVLACPALLFAQQSERPSVAVGTVKEGAEPAIDGKVDDEAWNTAVPYSGFTQQEPNEGEPASEQTEIRFLADRKNLYISVIAFDREPDRIIVTQSRRDADLNDTDSVQILLDTFNDGQNAFVFGTNPFAIEHDGQVMNEGQTSGQQGRAGAGGSQGGQVSGYNTNWDADWTVHAGITSRGWEAEFSIPLKTLRYKPGQDQTWGVNALRIIRRRNEQAFLAAVPRGYNIHRVSVAGKLTGLDLPSRRQLQLIPFGLSSVVDNKTVQTRQVTRNADIGLDMKWGVTSTVTLDVTVNTDFAQVEADEQQINLTRFPLFFPEKRPFFLENAQTFQFGQPQSVDLFFSRRIGIGSNGAPIPIMGGARLSGKLNGYNVGVLNMQTESEVDERTNAVLAPTNNFSVFRVVRELGRSNIGMMFVNRTASGRYALSDDFNRGYGLDMAWQASTNGKLFAFLARTDSPERKGGSDHAGRLFYSYANPLVQSSFGYSQVGNDFNPEVGFLARRNYRRVEGRAAVTYDPARWDWIRRIAPHTFFNGYWNQDDGELETFDGHWHAFSIEQSNGGRFGYAINTAKDRPRRPFTAYSDVTGRTVVIPPGDYSWAQGMLELITNQSAPLSMTLRQLTGNYYNGDYVGWQASVMMRAGAKIMTSIGWNRDKVSLPQGRFTNDLIPMKMSYSFTRLASVEGLLQYNSQASTFSSNIRLALLSRSGTGLFVVYNNQQETSDRTPATVLGRSFIVKLSRLFDL
jgi:hypothetical protein